MSARSHRGGSTAGRAAGDIPGMPFLGTTFPSTTFHTPGGAIA